MAKGATKSCKSMTEAIGQEPFYPDADRRELADCLESEFILQDARIVEGFTSAFGESDFALLKLVDGEGAIFTTLCGGMVVVKKVRQALTERLLPLRVTLNRHERYYDIV